MNYSIIAQMATKYGLGAVRAGVFIGGCFISYGFGLVRGERRVIAEIDGNLGIVKREIELIIDEKGWNEAMKKAGVVGADMSASAHPY